MEAMTFAELKTLAKTLVDEKGLFWSDDQMKALANTAMRTVFRQIAGFDATHFAAKTTITYPADTESIDLTGASYFNITPSVYKVLAVSKLSEAAAVTPTNRPVHLDRTDAASPLGYGDNWNDPNSEARGVSASRRWFLDASNLYLVFIPAEATPLLIRWVNQPTDLDGASDVVFAGRAFEYHDLVATTLARLMVVKERRMADEIVAISDWLRMELQQAERSRSQHPQVRYESPY